MKFKEGIVVFGKFVNGSKTFGSSRYMKDILKKKFTRRGMKSCISNITDVHTCAIGGVNLLMSAIFVTNSQLLKFAGDMICGATISIPVGVDAVGFCRSSTVLIVFVIAEVTLLRFMVGLLADLTWRPLVSLRAVALIDGVVLIVVALSRTPWIESATTRSVETTTTTRASAISTASGRHIC